MDRSPAPPAFLHLRGDPDAGGHVRRLLRSLLLHHDLRHTEADHLALLPLDGLHRRRRRHGLQLGVGLWNSFRWGSWWCWSSRHRLDVSRRRRFQPSLSSPSGHEHRPLTAATTSAGELYRLPQSGEAVQPEQEFNFNNHGKPLPPLLCDRLHHDDASCQLGAMDAFHYHHFNTSSSSS